MLKRLDLTPLPKQERYTYPLSAVNLMSLATEEMKFNTEMQDLFHELDQLSDSCEELIYIHRCIDEFKTDPSFQEAVGLRLEQQGYTSSMEVGGGISKTMHAIIDKILTFFSKIMQYIQKVMMVNCSAAAELVHKLSEACKDPNTVEKLTKEYTTNDVSVATLTTLFQYLVGKQKKVKEVMDKLKAMQSSTADQPEAKANQQIEAQGQQQQAKPANDSELEQIMNKLNEEAGNGKGTQNTGNGLTPQQGGWFSPSYLNNLEAALKGMEGYINMLKTTQSDVRSMANSIKSDSQLDKSLAKTKLDTIKNFSKEIDKEIKVIMQYANVVGRKCQTILKLIKK